ncbi:prenyltransferase/squalene oxidase repeat-containing protein [Rossellomorea marisflavi]|uniref:hypothetical protein n=1 Tax=Rossellomorea marisflavi TaxID=189381 RepID=UPI0011E61A1C|nr:hypothetical protein [Rossellomorea marisflavi]TYO69965.1 hypothetical protein DQ398_003252 [Rossellomorea marisflavi]
METMNEALAILNKDKMNNYIVSATSRDISRIWQCAAGTIYWWMGVPSTERIDAIQSNIPELKVFIDFDAIKERLAVCAEQDDSNPWVTVNDFFPELVEVRDRFQEAFIAIESGVLKAEAWLYYSALEAGANADLEALIYFQSQGETITTSTDISENWINWICTDVERQHSLNRGREDIIKKAKNNELSLLELTDLYKEADYFPNFLSARDEEEDYITATFFRAVEWLQLEEFGPWVDAYSHEVSTVYQGGVDPVYSLYPLFFYCRSDLLLRKTSKFGLEALLYGICVGNVESSRPWKRYSEKYSNGQTKPIFIDYIPTASIIAFAWQRINPTNINKDILDNALLLLMQTQLASGAWPLTSKDTEGSILSTCLAMTALSVVKPVGYQRYVEAAKEWLLSQQNEVGCWYIQGGPPVMLNILCLEAIKLAEGNNQITYRVQEHQIGTNTPVPSIRKQIDSYIVFCEGHYGGTKNKSFDEKCYTKIFSLEFPNAVFCSAGACKDIEAEEKLLFNVIEKVNPFHTIIKLLDRDDRSSEEIEELKTRGVTVLSLRELESYLLEDEIIEKLCKVCGKKEKTDVVKAIKVEALKKSIDRGNPIDDYKSAAGLFFTETKKILGLTKCGNDTISFLRDTMAPLITQETNTYKLLRKDVFGI